MAFATSDDSADLLPSFLGGTLSSFAGNYYYLYGTYNDDRPFSPSFTTFRKYATFFGFNDCLSTLL
jgi:hypothetical protein